MPPPKKKRKAMKAHKQIVLIVPNSKALEVGVSGLPPTGSSQHVDPEEDLIAKPERLSI